MAAALLLVFTLAATGDAPAAPEDADAFARGRAAYDEVRLRDAAVLFREAAEAADDDPARVLALLWAGVAAGQAGELAIARRAFDDALRIDCAPRLPTTVSPKVEAVFHEALALAHPRGCVQDHAPPGRLPQPSTPTTTSSPTPPTPAATPPATAAQPPPDRLPSALGLGLVGVGGAALAVAAGVTLKGAADVATAADPRTPQVEAGARLNDGNLALTIAAVTGLAGALVLAGGVASLVVDGAAP